MRGPGVLTFAEIDAWARLTGRAVTGEEALALRSLDCIHHNQLNSKWQKTSQS